MTWRKRAHAWIPASFALVAGLLTELALDRGGWRLCLLWPAADCAAVAAAYFLRGGSGVFGKREDGSFSPRALLMLPFLAAIQSVWRLQVLLTPEPCWSEVAPGLFLGRRPLKGEHPPGLDLVVDLTSEFAKPSYHPQGAAYRCLPTLDAFVPGEAAFRALVDEAARAPRVFIHCANGHGRSAAFAAALLIRKGSASSVEEAMTPILAARPACRLNPAQEALVTGALPPAQAGAKPLG